MRAIATRRLVYTLKPEINFRVRLDIQIKKMIIAIHLRAVLFRPAHFTHEYYVRYNIDIGGGYIKGMPNLYS